MSNLPLHSPGEITRTSLAALQQCLEGVTLSPEQRATVAQTCQMLEARAQHYQVLFESMAVGYLVTDEAGVISEANPAAASLLGVSREALPGRSLTEFVTEEMRAVYAMRLSQWLTDVSRLRPGRSRLDVTLVPAAGAPFSALLMVSQLPDRDGRPLGLSWLFYDVTPNRLAEDALRSSEARLKLALEAAREGLYDRQVDSHELYFSPTCATLLGYAPGEFSSEVQDLVRLVHPADWPAASQIFTGDLANMEDLYAVEFRMRTKAGDWRWLLGLGQVLARAPDGSARRTVGTVRDITRRKLAEDEILRLNTSLEQRVQARTAEYEAAIVRLEAEMAKNNQAQLELQASEEQYRALVETSPDSIILCDLQGTIRMVNMQTVTLFGYGSAAEMIGQTSLDFLAASDRLRALAMFGKALVEASVETAEYIALRTDGSTFDAEIRVALVKTMNSSPDGLLIVTRDVTERRQMEGEVRRLAQDLERRVAVRTRELEALYKVTALGGEMLNLQIVLDRSLALVLATVGGQAGAIHLVRMGAAEEREGPETSHLSLAAHQSLPAALAVTLKTVAFGAGAVGQVALQGQPLVSVDLTADAALLQLPALGDFSAYVGTPMRAQGRKIVGVLSIFSTERSSISAEAVTLLASIADQMGGIIESAWLRRQAEAAAVMEERQRLARDLHDSVTQALYSLALIASAAQVNASAGNLARLSQHLETINETAQTALREMRLLIHALRPPILEQAGLAEALRLRLNAVEERVGLKTVLQIEEVGDLAPEMESELYSMAQEALNNVLKHAHATQVTVRLVREAEVVVLEVGDDGQGFDPEQARLRGGLGLTSLRERVEKLGGELEMHSTVGGGSHIQVKVPRTGSNAISDADWL